MAEVKRKRDRDRDEERDRGKHLDEERFSREEPDYSIISKQEREDAELVLKHNLPASLVREMAAKGRVKLYGEARIPFTGTVAPRTLKFIRGMGEKWGMNQGRALDKIVEYVERAMREYKGDEDEESAVERSAKRRKG